MDEGDRRLRNATYGLFVELGRAPTSEETAPSVEADEGVVLAVGAGSTTSTRSS